MYNRWNRSLLIFAVATLGTTAAFAQNAARYDSPEAALKGLHAACKAGELDALWKVFGSDAKGLLSGDAVSDKADLADFAKRLAAGSRLENNDDGSRTVLVGAIEHPFAVPIVQKDNKWMFDIEAGKEEILNRRIGGNELDTIAVCRAYVVAQREYAQADRDGDEVMEYAQKVASSTGKKDGLYWTAAEGEPRSPLGELVAEATAAGYDKPGQSAEPRPYHGYLFRILTAQGKDAPGGAFNYIINGNMVAGFALVAYPLNYGNSGVMTFMVNANGVVVEKDLGENTAKIAAQMKTYNRDSSWKVVTD